MNDNFELLSLTDNPFPQNPTIIIDDIDDKTNGRIHDTKIFEDEHETFEKLLKLKTNLIYICGSQTVRGDGKSAFIAYHHRQIETDSKTISIFIQCTDRNGKVNNPDRFCREFLLKCEKKNYLWKAFSKLLPLFVKDDPNYEYAYSKFIAMFSKFNTPPNQLPLQRYTKISNTKNLAKSFCDWLCDKCGCSQNVAHYFSSLYLEKPQEMQNQLQKSTDKVQEYDDILKILLFSGFSHVFIFLNQMEDALENISTKITIEFTAGIRRIIEKSNGNATMICTIHPSSLRTILDNPQAKVNITSLAPMDNNHKIMLFPENIQKNSKIIGFISSYLSYFHSNKSNENNVTPFEKNVLEYAAQLTGGNLRDILRGMYNCINIALEKKISNINMNFIKINHKEIFDKDFSQEIFDKLKI